MDKWSLVLAIFGGIAVGQSFFLSAFLFFNIKEKFSPNFFLGLLLSGLSFRLGKSIFYYLIPQYKIVGLSLGAFGLFLIGPALYFFIRQQIKSDPKWAHGLHFLPALVILFSGQIWSKINVSIIYTSGTYLIGGYLIASWILIRQLDHQQIRSATKIILASVIGIFIIFAAQMYIGAQVIYALGSALCGIILYGINFYILTQKDFIQFSLKTKVDHIPTNANGELIQALQQLFENQKIYREKGLTINRVADVLGKPSYLVSKIINQHFDMKFNDFVNKYRIKEAKEKLCEVNNQYKIEILGKEVGFSSTSTFYQAFKKEVELTPQAFRKQTKSNYVNS